MHGYIFFHCDSTTKAGGVGAYFKNTTDAKHIQELSKSFDGCESLWIEFGPNKENVIVGVVYRHPHNNMNVFQESIMQTLHKLTVNKKYIYVMGDFNIDLLKSSSSNVLDFVNLTNRFGLRNLINKPTRVTKETQTLLDHIYTNDSKHRMNSGVSGI